MEIVTEKKIKGSAQQLRGFVSKMYPEYTELHNHDCNKLVYGYPHIQYKIINGKAYIIGIEDGMDIIKEIYSGLSKIKLGNTLIKVDELKFDYDKFDFGVCDETQYYTTKTPYIALNSANYDKYIDSDELEKDGLLKKIVTGNLLSMSKSFDYHVENKIDVKIMNRIEQSVKIKGMGSVGFHCIFNVNFEIPNMLGIGRNVAKGFGSVEKLNGIGK